MNVKAIQHFGKLLVNYHNSDLTPPHFLSELKTGEDGKFWSNIWEALLYDYLNNLNFKFVKGVALKSGNEGPDFGIEYQGKVIWIEAVVPEPTNIPAEDLEPPYKKFKVRTEQHEKKLLRWTSVIKDKKDKISRYRQAGLIGESDPVIVAVNSCRLQDWAIDDNGISLLPYAVEATFPVGPRAIPLTRQGKVAGPSQNIARYSVRKDNGSEVPTDAFLNPEFGSVSAIIGTQQRDLWNGPLRLSLVHNPLASSSLPRNAFGANREYVCELEDDRFTLRNILDLEDQNNENS